MNKIEVKYNMKTIVSFLGVISLTWCLWSCKKSSSYSEIPEIHFKKLIIENQLNSFGSTSKMATLTFHFIDGDGDLGVRNPQSNDTLSQAYVTWKKKLGDGTYETFKFDDGSILQPQRIPFNNKMNRDEAQNKVLQGTIDVSLFAPSISLGDTDTMRLEYYIMDRALHTSNIDYTPDFSILDETVHIE